MHNVSRVSAWKIQPTFDSRFLGKAAGRLANAAPLLGWLPATPAAVTAAPAQALRAAAATRGSASSSAAASSFPWFCATSSGVLPYCNRGEGAWGRQASP